VQLLAFGGTISISMLTHWLHDVGQPAGFLPTAMMLLSIVVLLRQVPALDAGNRSPLQHHSIHDHWESFKARYGKKYGSHHEEDERYVQCISNALCGLQYVEHVVCRVLVWSRATSA
jgi:hypothetical protein